jgi:futalosine hydrolase
LNFNVVSTGEGTGMNPDVLVIAATREELSWAGDFYDFCETRMGRLVVAFCVTGPGQVNTAYSLGRVLSGLTPRLILSVGIGGAYPSSGLFPGDIAVATTEVDADWGVEPIPPEIQPRPILVPRVRLPGANLNFFIPLSKSHARSLLLSSCEFCNAAEGPFVTSSTVTATEKRARQMEELYGAICENMEGYAAAQVAMEEGILFAEIRGISNMAGPRDLSKWKMKEAVKVAGRGAKGFLVKLEAECK